MARSFGALAHRYLSHRTTCAAGPATAIPSRAFSWQLAVRSRDGLDLGWQALVILGGRAAGRLFAGAWPDSGTRRSEALLTSRRGIVFMFLLSARVATSAMIP
jgi:hypothetical protein